MSSRMSVFAGICALLGTLLLLTKKRRKYKLPSGPPGLPILGNALQLPKEFLHFKFQEWAKQYGPIYCLNILGTPWLILNDSKIAADVLDRNSAATSNRMPQIKAQEFYSRGNLMPAIQHTIIWRRFRKGAHESMNARACEIYWPLQQEEAALTVRNLLEHPDTPVSAHAARLSSSIAWRVLYGGPALELNKKHEWNRLEELADELFRAGLPTNSFVDMFPFTKGLIQSSSLLMRTADRWFAEANTTFMRIFREGCANQLNAYPTTCQTYRRMMENGELSETHGAWSAGALFLGGQDTTATALQWFIQAMMVKPEVARRAQKELDTVVADRPPAMADREKLPYIQACVKELTRWRPSAPLSLPHCASEDFAHNGYVIPKGTIIIDNLWAMLHDPAVFPSPSTFDPNRFLDDDGQVRAPPSDTHGDFLAFGHGRRVCPGRELAVNSLFILIATLLWALHFELPLDDEGKEKKPDPMGMIDVFVSVHPKPFEVRVRPRFPDVLERLRSS